MRPLDLFASYFAFATFFTFLYTSSRFTSASVFRYSSAPSSPKSGSGSVLHSRCLVHYASFSNATHRMTDIDIRDVFAVLRARALQPPCLRARCESPLWLALNHDGRTVFLGQICLLLLDLLELPLPDSARAPSPRFCSSSELKRPKEARAARAEVSTRVNGASVVGEAKDAGGMREGRESSASMRERGAKWEAE